MSVSKKLNRAGIMVYKPTKVNTKYVKRSEDVEAVDFFQHAQHKYGLGMLLFHVTNEGKMSHQRGQLLNQAGRQKGVADYILLKPSGDFPFAAIELKRADGGNASKEQKKFLLKCIEAGGFAVIAHGFDAAMAALEDYFGKKKK